MQNSKLKNSKLNRMRFDRMCKNLALSHKDLARLTGNSYESIRKVLHKEVPRWAMLAVCNDELYRNTASINRFSSMQELFEWILAVPDYDDNDKIKSLIAHLNYGFVDYPLSPEKLAILEEFKKLL